EPAPPGVAQLLEAERQDAVVDAGRDRHRRVPEGVHAGRTVVLDPRDRDVVALEIVAERRAGEPALERPDPRRLDPVRLDAGVAERLERGLDDQILRGAVVVLPELAAAHPDDGDAITDAHAGLAFQK